MITKINFLLFFCLLIQLNSCVQPVTDSVLLNANAPFTLVGDTLFHKGNLKIYSGKKLISGQGSGENGWYKAITFKNPANWVNLIGRDMEIKNNVDYQFDEGIRDRDKVKEYLNPGDTLEVTKIEKLGNEKSGYWYVVNMRQGQGLLSLQYRCYIAEALKSEEMLLVSN